MSEFLNAVSSSVLKTGNNFVKRNQSPLRKEAAIPTHQETQEHLPHPFLTKYSALRSTSQCSHCCKFGLGHRQ